MDWNDFLDYLRTLPVTAGSAVDDGEGEVELHVLRERRVLQGRDIQAFLCSPQNVTLVYEALGNPPDSGVVISGVEITEEVEEALDTRFNFVDYV